MADQCTCGEILSRTPSQTKPGKTDYVVKCHNATRHEYGEIYVTTTSDEKAISLALAKCVSSGDDAMKPAKAKRPTKSKKPAAKKPGKSKPKAKRKK